MNQERLKEIFSSQTLRDLMPEDRANKFFEAMLGDASDGAFDISLIFKGYSTIDRHLLFELQLMERPGKCLACNLTYGLPQVFKVHPIINLKQLVEDVNRLLGDLGECEKWTLGKTQPISSSMHTIPLAITVEPQQ